MEMTIGQVLHIAGGARINGDKRGLAMTDVTAPDVVALARRFIEAIPHSRALGMRLESLGEGRVVMTMPYDLRFVGDTATGVMNGGAVSALMDTASGAAVMCHPAAPIATATLDLRIDYFRPATPGQSITARAECYHVTRSVAFVRVTATDEDDTRPVAAATGAFTLDRPKGVK
jgi:uncharacterized protein (TIGR00369 family)